MDVTTITDDALRASLIPPAKSLTFTVPVSLNTFIERLSANGNRVRCCICQQSFARNIRTIVNHYYLHVDTSFYWLSCLHSECKYTSFSRTSCGSHYRSVHGSNKPTLHPAVDDIVELFYDATLREARTILRKVDTASQDRVLAGQHLRAIFLSSLSDSNDLTIETTLEILRQCPRPWLVNNLLCPVCCKALRLTHRSDLVDHLYLHLSRTFYPYHCPHPACSRAEMRQSRMKMHYSAKHGKWSEDVAKQSYHTTNNIIYRTLRLG